MGLEIERKFLVTGSQWQELAQPQVLRQGYLCADPARSVRVRIAGNKAWLTIKSGQKGVSRAEFEYEIPLTDAEAMLSLCQEPLIEKERRKIDFGGNVWEVDRFFGANEGLVVAEIELENEQQPFAKPDWVGEEVSQDPRYLNANLIKSPYSQW